jgi:UDP-glucose 4-epimerase
VRETAELHPENPYGESKLLVERMLKWFDTCHGLRSVILRYFNAAGAALDGENGEDPRYVQNLIPVVMKVATGRAPIAARVRHRLPHARRNRHPRLHPRPRPGRGACPCLGFSGRRQASDVFNIGTGQGASVREVLTVPAVSAAWTSRPSSSGAGPAIPAAVYADNRKAREVLGWTPRYGVEEIIQSAWRWHHGHPDGFASAK